MVRLCEYWNGGYSEQLIETFQTEEEAFKYAEANKLWGDEYGEEGYCIHNDETHETYDL